MIYAPICIPTLCRYEHFYKCLESLRKNFWAKYTEVFIGLDYPAKKTHWDGYLKIKKYLEGDFPEFKKVHIIIREKNYGPSLNGLDLYNRSLAISDRFIRTDDDVEFSPNFIQYMDVMLDKYESDPDVFAVTGFSYPVNYKADKNSNAVKENFAAYTWGIGFWRDKRQEALDYVSSRGLVKDFPKVYSSGKMKQLTDWAVKDYVNGVTYGCSQRSCLCGLTDISMRIYLTVKNKYVVMPLLSKAKNHGFDGSGVSYMLSVPDDSGVYTSSNYPFDEQPIDLSDTFEAKVDEHFDLELNRKLLNDFDKVADATVDALWKRAEWYCQRSEFLYSLLYVKASVRSFLAQIYHRLYK